MANLTKAQLASLASDAGFSGSDVNIAAAVALAESNGNPKAHNAKPPDDSYGLWQINMIGALGPDRRKKFGIKNNSDLFDPATNAKAARIIFAGSGWGAWTTYSKGTYKQYMDASDATTGGATTSGDTGLFGIGAALNAVGINIFKSLANVVGVIIAMALIVTAIVILAMQSKGGNKLVKSAVGKVIP